MRGERDGESERGRKQRGKRKYEGRSQGPRERTRVDCNAECLNFIGKRNWEKGSKVQKLKRFRVGGRGVRRAERSQDSGTGTQDVQHPF